MNRFYTLLLLLTLPVLTHAQQSYALKPYAITLPRVVTTQQVNPATVAQGAGNVVYNTTEQKVAVSTGTDRSGNGQWKYLQMESPDATNFPNFTSFQSTTALQSWTIPAGVTRFMVELWGGGAGGRAFFAPNSGGTQYVYCQGGGAGGYARKIVQVVSGVTAVSLICAAGGTGGRSTPYAAANSGGQTFLIYNNQSINVEGGYDDGRGGNTYNFGGTSDGIPGSRAIFIPGGHGKEATLTYAQQNSTTFVTIVKGGNGGTSYGVDPAVADHTFQMIFPSGNFANSPIASVGSGGSNTFVGVFPGGGGGCSYFNGADGAPGLVIIRW